VKQVLDSMVLVINVLRVNTVRVVWNRLCATHARLVGRLRMEVRNVPNATLVKQVLDSMALVMNVLRVNTVRAVWNRLRAMHAPLVIVKVTKDKLRVPNAAPVNSMICLVRRHANHAQTWRILVAKEETVVALIAQVVGCPKMEVRNVSRVVRVRLAKAVKIAQLDLLDQEKTTQPNANNATEVLQPQHRAPPSAAAVT
jgi:hypothetical protein